MIFAGLSEILLLMALSFALFNNVKNGHNIFQSVCIFITALAAAMGLLRYLEIIDTQEIHALLSFLAKHFAMPGFLISLIWKGAMQSKAALMLISLSLTLTILNGFHPIAIFTDALIILLSCYFGYLVFESKVHFIQVISAITILLSTLVWTAIISDMNVRIGLFHLCLSLYFVFMASAATGIQTGRRFQNDRFGS